MQEVQQIPNNMKKKLTGILLKTKDERENLETGREAVIQATSGLSRRQCKTNFQNLITPNTNSNSQTVTTPFPHSL
jgi:hypothetical protein